MSTDLFRSCLGEESFHELPWLVQKAHRGNAHMQGTVDVRKGNFFAKVICHLLQMPPERMACPLVVKSEHHPDVMLWQRWFDGFEMHSQFAKQGEHLVESLGPVKFKLQVFVENSKLIYRLCQATFLGIPLPRFFSPKVYAQEYQDGTNYLFSVEVSLPFIGPLISYSGKMALI